MSIPFILPGIKPSVVKLQKDLAYFFPELTHFYGYAGTPDHNTKRCLDAMVYDSSGKYVAQQGRANLPYSERIKLGDRLAAFLIKNAEHYHLNGIIWNRRVMGFPGTGQTGNYRGPYGEWRTYKISAHDDHIHIDQDGRDFKSLIPSDGQPAVTVWIDRLVPGVTDSDSIRAVQKVLGVPETGTLDEVTLEAAKAKQRSWGDSPIDGLFGPKQTALLFQEAGRPVEIRTDPSGQAPPPVTPPPVVKPPSKPDVSAEDDKEPKPVTATETICGFNILRRTDTEPGRKRWPARKPLIGKTLRAIDASVYLLIETDSTTRADCGAELGSNFTWWGYKYYGIYWDQRVWERTGEATNEKEFRDNNNRFLLSIPLRHKATGKVVNFDCTHLENDGDPNTDGHKARYAEASHLAELAGKGNRVGYFDCNSTTPANVKNPNSRQLQKPRVVLARKIGATFLTELGAKITNWSRGTHHGGKGGTKGPIIDDAWVVGDVEIVGGEFYRTDTTDASDHNALKFTIKF